MNSVKRKALIFIQVVLACNFIILGQMFSGEEDYKYVIISVSIIGSIACIYEAIRLYKNRR